MSSINKINEHLLIPLLMGFTLASLLCLIYLIYEYTRPIYEIREFYGWDLNQFKAYQSLLIGFILFFTISIPLHLWAIRVKNRWFYLVLIALSILALSQMKLIL